MEQKYKCNFPYVFLEECFDQISLPERMEGVNNIYCNNCSQYCSADYITLLNTSPEVMTIILNRGKGNIHDVEFDFPLRIDINKYVNFKNKSSLYDLIGVLVHTGGSDMSGHFFAFCKSNVDHNWYMYNDSFVSMCGDNYENDIKNKGLPYVLFYQNVDCINNSNQIFSLYFRYNGNDVYDRIELYFDVNRDELFSNVVQRLAQKYNNCNFNFLNVRYFIETNQGNQFIDFNKTVKDNNLSIYSNVIMN